MHSGMRSTSSDVTILLKRWSEGDSAALQELIPIIYDDLRGLANYYLLRERAGHTLQSTALVHEVYLRLVNQRNAQWQNRGHFFAVASQIIRRILVDHARRHQSEKRGCAISPLSLDDALTVPVQRDLDVVALDESLIDLAAVDSL